LKKIFCLLLCISLLFSSIPIYARSIEELENSIVVEEIINLRDEYTKHFRNEDGSITAASYPQPIHYLDEDGNWKDIDNTLIEEIIYDTSLTFDYFSNNKNNLNKNQNSEFLKLKNNPNIGTLFSKKADNEELIKVNIEGHEISWSIENVSSASGKITNHKSKDKYNLTNLTNRIIYEEVFLHIDLIYYIASSNLKEEFHIKSKTDITSFVYNVTTDLKATKTDHDLVIFRDEFDEDIMIFQNPYMYDSAEESGITFNTVVEIEETETGYKLTYLLDEEWLNSEERVYPIIVDPYITNAKTRSNILDTYVHPNDAASHNHVNQDRLFIGNREGGSRAFMDWGSLPSINGTITNAAFDFNYFQGTSTWGPIQIYKVNSAWDSYTITWNSHHNLGYDLLYSGLIPTYRNGYYNFFMDVTNVVKNWYAYGGKYGFMVRYDNESYNDYNAIVSSDGGAGSDFWPTLKIWYESPSTGTYESLNWQYPVNTAYTCITSDFSSSHRAVDIVACSGSIKGQPIYAVESGIINWAGFNDSGGNMISIKSDSYDPYTGKQIVYNYMHMVSQAIKTSGRVAKGELIGYVGDSGKDSYGFHLHFETYAPTTLLSKFGAGNYPFAEVINPREFYSII